MKPGMPHDVKVRVPELDANGKKTTDSFGRTKLVPKDTKARVFYVLKTVYSQNGTSYTAHVEVDLPPDVPVEEGGEIQYTDTQGNIKTRRIVSIGSSTNFSGRIVYFRTVFLG